MQENLILSVFLPGLTVFYPDIQVNARQNSSNNAVLEECHEKAGDFFLFFGNFFPAFRL